MRRILGLFIVLFLLFGCISEGTYSNQKNELSSEANEYDFLDNGLYDFYHYTFSKVDYDGYSISREVYVYPKYSITSFSFNQLNKAKISEALSLFGEFSDEVKSNFETCSKKLGIANVKCGIIEQCAAKCYESSSECKRLVQLYPEFAGYEVLTIDEANSERIKLTNAINADIWGYESLSAIGKQKLFENLRELYSLSVFVTNGPVFYPNTLSLCSGEIDYSNYKTLMILLGNESIEPEGYEYFVILNVERTNSLGTNEYADLFVKEKIPITIIPGSVNIVQDSSLSGNVIEWYPIKSEKKQEILFYSFESQYSPDQIIWKTPQFKKREIDLTLLLPSFSIFGILVLALGYYNAVSFAIAIPLIIVIFLLNLIILLYNVVLSKIKKYSIYRAIKNFVGIPNLSWKKDLVFGAVLFAIGIGASFFALHTDETQIEISKLLSLLFEDYAALISVFCSVIGLLFIYTSLQSFVKSQMIQLSYSEVLKKETDIVKSEAKELDLRLEELKKMIDEYEKEGFDTTESYEVYISIPKEGALKISKENVEKKGAFVERSLNKIENSIAIMKERKEYAQKNWPEWSKLISNELEKEKELYISNALFIPVSLRSWAINRYLSENSGKNIVLEGDILKIKQEAPTKLAENAMESGNITNAIILKNDKVVLSIVNSGNKTLVLGLMFKLKSYLKTFVLKQNQKEYKYFMGISNSMVFALMKKGEIESLIFCPADKFKVGFEQWKEVLSHMN